MKTFSIPVTWEVWDKIEVNAETIEEAIKYVKENIDDIPLGTQPEYIDGSYKIDDGENGEATIKETVEYLKEYYNIDGYEGNACCRMDDKLQKMRDKRWENLPDVNDTLKTWLDDFLENTNKMSVEELTIEEIDKEIKGTEGLIENLRMWGDKHAIIDNEEYIKLLKELGDKNNGVK